MKDNEFEMRLCKHSRNMKDSIEAPFDITEKIDEMERENMSKKVYSFAWLKKTAYSVATAAAAFVLVVNCVPRLAYAASDVPILGNVVRVVTFGRFEVSKGNVEANINTPKIEGLIDKELKEKLNREFEANANTIIAAFENDVREMEAAYGDDNFYLSVTADYEVKTDNEDVLAVDFYFTTIEASAVTAHRFYNIDKKEGKLITLASLFEEGSDYVTPISDYILAEMKVRNDVENGFYFLDGEESERFTKIRENHNFYINGEGNIVICFDEYEVAAGAEGSPEFEIPNDVIKDILK